VQQEFLFRRKIVAYILMPGGNMNVKQLLERLNQGEKLDSPTLERLNREGYIKAQDVSNFGTLPGEKDFLFIHITEKGRQLLLER
jgi:hypothetical protein